MNNKKLKEKALKNLKGNYSVIISALLIFFISTFACNAIGRIIHSEFIGQLLTLIVEGLMFMGIIKMATKISKRKKVEINDLFSKTDLMFKYIGITIIFVFIAFIFVIFEYLAFESLKVVIVNYTQLNPLLAIILILVGMVLSAAVIIAGIYLTISFSQVLFILNDEPKLKITQIFSKSFDMMSNYIFEYFILALSFIGWLILGLFTLGILYLWLFPYMLVTFANFYNVLKKEYKKYVDSEPEELFTAIPKNITEEK